MCQPKVRWAGTGDFRRECCLVDVCLMILLASRPSSFPCRRGAGCAAVRRMRSAVHHPGSSGGGGL